jgi:hypothetical protein
MHDWCRHPFIEIESVVRRGNINIHADRYLYCRAGIFLSYMAAQVHTIEIQYIEKGLYTDGVVMGIFDRRCFHILLRIFLCNNI